MRRTEQDSTANGSELLDTSLELMLLLILGLLLSFASLLLQRNALSAAGNASDPSPARLRRTAGVLTLWCAGAFFLLSLRAARCSDGVLSRADLTASLLALAAAFLRLWVLENATERGDGTQGAESGALLPHLIFDSLPA